MRCFMRVSPPIPPSEGELIKSAGNRTFSIWKYRLNNLMFIKCVYILN